jgi:hypothetical protein
MSYDVDRLIGTTFPLIPETQHDLLIDELHRSQYQHDSAHSSINTNGPSIEETEEEEGALKKGFSLSRRLWHYLLHKSSISPQILWSSLSTTVLHRIAETVCRSRFTTEGYRHHISFFAYLLIHLYRPWNISR